MSEVGEATQAVAVDIPVQRSKRLFPAGAERLPFITAVCATIIMAVGADSLEQTPSEAVAAQPPIRQEGNKRHCTSFRVAPNDIQTGWGCREDGTTAEPVGNGYRNAASRQWVYSAIVMGGANTSHPVKKCFYVRDGVLNEPEKSDPQLVAACHQYAPDAAQTRYPFLTDFNCGFQPNGWQACRSGTFFSRLAKACSDRRLYRNFATEKPSAWNVEGGGQDRLSEPVAKLYHRPRRAVSYRAQIAVGTQPIIVRDLKKDEEWGIMLGECVPQHRRSGGTPVKIN